MLRIAKNLLLVRVVSPQRLHALTKAVFLHAQPRKLGPVLCPNERIGGAFVGDRSRQGNPAGRAQFLDLLQPRRDRSIVRFGVGGEAGVGQRIFVAAIEGGMSARRSAL